MAERFKLAVMSDYAELDALSTDELRRRAFDMAKNRRDPGFFWELVRLLPHADDVERLDNSSGSIGSAIEDAVGMWREFTKHEYGGNEPVVRAAFIEYVLAHEAEGSSARHNPGEPVDQKTEK